jgi:predicted PurR-regulated permease PerM
LVFLVWYSVEMLLLIFAGVLFAVFIRGVNGFLFGRILHLPEKIGITLTILLLLALLCLFFILLVPQLVEQGEKLAAQLPEALALLQEQSGLVGWALDMLKTEESSPLNAAGKITVQAMGIFTTTLGSLTSFFIIVFVGLYLSYTPRYYREGILSLIPAPARKKGDQILQALDYTLGHWLIGRFIGMFIISISAYIGLWLLEVPLALALATLAGLLTLIPNIGPILSAIPAILLGFTQSSLTAALVVLLFVVIEFIESYLVTPLVQQKQVEMPPVLTVSAQVVLGSALGILGLALATPLTAAILVLVKLLYVEQVLGEEAGVKGIESGNFIEGSSGRAA